MKARFRKFVAVASAVTLLTSSGVSTVLPVAVTASAAETTSAGVATEIKVYDSKGKDVSVNVVTPISNTELNQPNHEFTEAKYSYDSIGRRVYVKEMYEAFTVVLDNPDDSLAVAQVGSAKLGVKNPISVTNEGDGVYKVRIITKRVTGSYSNETATSQTVTTETMPEGEYTFTLTTASGNIYRAIHVSVRSVFSSIEISLGDKSKLLEIVKSQGDSEKGFYELQLGGFVAIANHQMEISKNIKGSKYDNVKYAIVADKNDTPTNIAEITQDGVFTPKSSGTGYLKVMTSDDSEHWCAVTASVEGETVTIQGKERKTTCKEQKYKKFDYPAYIHFIVVKENPAKSLSFINAPNTIYKGSDTALKLEKIPTYNSSEYATSATDTITWTSSDPKVATVSKDGVVTPKTSGKVVIRAQGESSNVFVEHTITVVAKASSLTINENPILLASGSTINISATMKPVEANEKITWTTEDSSIAKVEESSKDLGNTQSVKLTGVSDGVTKIYARTASGKEFVGTVTVNSKPPVDNFEIYSNNKQITNNATLVVYDDQTIELTGKSFTKGTFLDNEVTWELTDSSGVVRVLENSNTLKFKTLTTGTIKVKAICNSDSSITRTFTMKIAKSANEIILFDKDGNRINYSKDIIKGVSLPITVKLTANGSEQHNDSVASWESSNKSVATVSSTGVVIPVGSGTTDLTVTTASGRSKKVTINVRVLSKIAIKEVTSSNFELVYSSTSMKKQFTVVAYDDENKRINGLDEYWTSSNKNVAEVSSNGTVTVKGKGTSKISVQVGNRRTSFNLIVKVSLNQCTISPIGNIEYQPGKTSYNPATTVKYGNTVLDRGNKGDYVVSYENNKGVGRATAILTGVGEFVGTKSVVFSITPKDITTGTSVKGLTNKVYTGNAIAPSGMQVYSGNYLMKPGTDYTFTVSNNIKVGTAKIVIRGMGNFKGVYNASFNITPKSLASTSGLSISIDKFTYEYTGRDINPKVTAKLNGVVFKDFNVSYLNNKNVGTGTVKLTGKNNYNGTISKTFKIMQAYPSKITLNKSSYSLGVNETVTLKATIDKADFTKNKTIKWSSTNNSIAAVSNGKVVGKKAGTATIKATSANGKVVAQCKITVAKAPSDIKISLPKPSQVKSKSFDKNKSLTSITVKVGTKFQLGSSVSSGSVSNTRDWSTSNKSVVSIVDNAWNRSFKANKVGTATITVKTYNGKKATCKVTVVK